MKNHSSLTIFTTILSVLACFGLLPKMQAADGDLGGGNTNEGLNALNNLTTGGFKPGLGWFSQTLVSGRFLKNSVWGGSVARNKPRTKTPAPPGALLVQFTAHT